MIKPKTIKLADSNLANFGTQLEKDVKKAAAETEPAWANAGKELGLLIWRIEKFKVVSWPKEEYGSFYSGDSYIVLNTYKESDDSAKYKYNVHFWLGAHTSQDEAGTAAYKTVELDTLLGDEPVQYREVQGSESNEFLTLFPRGLRIMEGGVDSGFRKVKPVEYKPKLLHIKGKRKIRAMHVQLTHESLNSGDAFVLDAGMKIYVFFGKQAGIFEKNKAAELARAIDDERGGKPDTIALSEGDSDNNMADFWKLLGAPPTGPPKIKTAAEGGSDTEVAKKWPTKLFRASDASGKMTFKEEATGKITRAMLDPNDVFVVDVGQCIYAWIGKQASKEEKKKGMQLAVDYLKETGRPLETTVSRVVQGGENSAFWAFFDS
eukprot:CAMPEP_0198328986 /NCGR_PEP_ID=MMETSP1450-20131203/15851_1 /TAXON_ID=753684 ORGANISM="Madagascaria erythrocladiodes, Strain CCMP3234" /NCGR_SAMPLE_ID=MMETSP1450 /ASSEMBLY_ACC=CAM_ASM_001115 /LENGTH=376 /DNA_ID=CAMNT_0044033153 /DNA_START=165 /DNA_END=1295 /DNA_ORIENTATION=+